MKRQKLEKAPVHNLKEEKSVGEINYELHLRGREHLESVSKKLVISKSIDLIEDQSSEVKLSSYAKPAKEIKGHKIGWNEKLRKHEESGYENQEFLNLKKETEKYEILEFLKQQTIPGPFTKPAEVQKFDTTVLDSKAKQDRLRKEVKYIRLTTTILREDKEVLRLTRNSRGLSSEDYVENLMCYLDTARSCKSLTMTDLNHVLRGLAPKLPEVLQDTPSVSDGDGIQKPFSVGEHVAVFWLDQVYQWHLGVVENLMEDGVLRILYLKSTDSTKRSWVCPDDTEVYNTPTEQVLMRNIRVEYFARSVRIKCRICDDSLLKTLDSSIKELNDI